MHIESIEATGLVGFPAGRHALQRVDRIAGPHAVIRALADACLIPSCLVDEAALRQLLAGWGCAGVSVSKDGVVDGASWTEGAGLDALVEPEAEGLVRVSVVYRLDPPQFAALRDAAIRDPRLVDALAGGPTLGLGVGLRFAPAFDALAVDALSLTVGGVSFPTSGPERPLWLPALLSRLAGRVRASPLAPAEWGEAAATWSGAVQRRLRGALAELASGPAELEGLVALPGEPALLADEQLVPLRFLAPEAQAMVGWVGAALLASPDVLVARGAPQGSRWDAWWAAQVEADGSPLDQLLLLGARDGRALDG